MSSEPSHAGAPRGDGAAVSRGRRIAFRIIATIMAVSAVAFGLITAVFGLVSESQEIHAFHNTIVATLLLVLSAPAAIVAARAPERSTSSLMHLAAVGIAALVTMAIGVTLDPFTLPFALLVGVLWALRPGERSVTAVRPSAILLALVIVGAIPLVAYALGQAELQRIDSSSEHAEFFHWVETSFYAVAVLLLGLLAAMRPTAYRLPAWCAGVALAVMGGASLVLQRYASALAVPWAWAALAGGVVFVAVAEWETRRLTRAGSPRAPEARPARSTPGPRA